MRISKHVAFLLSGFSCFSVCPSAPARVCVCVRYRAMTTNQYIPRVSSSLRVCIEVGVEITCTVFRSYRSPRCACPPPPLVPAAASRRTFFARPPPPLPHSRMPVMITK